MNNRLPDRMKCVNRLIDLYEHIQDLCICIGDVFEVDAMHYYENLSDVITSENKDIYWRCSDRLRELYVLRDIISDKMSKQNTDKELELEENN